MNAKIYAYLCHATQPLGVGSDDDGDPADFNVAAGHLDWCPDSDGVGRDSGEARPEGVLPGRVSLPHGTMMRRAFERLTTAGISDVVCHSIPPHPDSELGQFMASRCYAEAVTLKDKRTAHWGECGHFTLNNGEQQVWDCDGSYEAAIQEVTNASNVITGTSINALAMTLKMQNMGGEGAVIDHPILQHLDELYPTYVPDGRSMDIWNPAIVDVLELAYRSLFGEGRRIGGLWLTLGGPFLWGEVSHYGGGVVYPVRTQAACEALGRDTDIDMMREGRDYAPVITKRIGRIALDLMERLKPLCNSFYFHSYTMPPYLWKPVYQAAGMSGVAQELCERMSDVEGINAHIIQSHAWDCSPQSAQHAMELQRRFPNVEFIAGVGWEKRLRTSGLARLSEGYRAIEVGMEDRDSWADLPDAVSHLRRVEKLL